MIFPLSIGKRIPWLLALSALLLCNCAGPVKMPGMNTAPQGWWRGKGVAGKPKIDIDLSEQVIHYFKGGQLVGVSPISSGREGHSTMTGSYRVTDKDIDHRSSIYGAYCDSNRQIVVPDVDCTKDERPKGTQFIGAAMPFFMRICGGVGMHEGYLPGYPASHGCIRLPRQMAEAFFFASPVGTSVEIHGDASIAAARNAPAVIPLPPGESDSKPKTKEAKPAPQIASAPAAPAQVKPKTKGDERKSWWRRGNEAKPKPLPFGTTVYLQ